MDHRIPDDILNSNLLYCIDEYVRIDSQKAMLKDRWFLGLTIEQIAEKYYLSETATKNIIYGIGDKILLKASKM